MSCYTLRRPYKLKSNGEMIIKSDRRLAKDL